MTRSGASCWTWYGPCNVAVAWQDRQLKAKGNGEMEAMAKCRQWQKKSVEIQYKVSDHRNCDHIDGKKVKQIM